MLTREAVDGARDLTRRGVVVAECVTMLRTGQRCAVTAVGRCVDCELPFCDSHRARRGATSYSDLCDGCQERRDALVQDVRAAEADRKQAAWSRLNAALAALVSSRSVLPTERRVLATGRKWFVTEVARYDVYEPAWPIGDQTFHFSEAYTHGDEDRTLPAGITRVGQIVPLLRPASGEQPVRKSPHSVRSWGGDDGTWQESTGAVEAAAVAIEQLLQ